MANYVDNFTDGPPDVALVSHTPDSGGTWTEVEDSAGSKSFEVNSGSMLLRLAEDNVNSQRLLYTISWTPATNEYDVLWTYAVSPVTNDDPQWVLARYTGTASYYAAGNYATGGNPDQKIVKVTAGPTRTLLASGNFATTTGDIFKFQVRTAAKKLFQGVTERLSSTDDTITAVGSCGLAMGNLGDVSTDDLTDGQMDVFKLEDVVAGGGRIMSSLAAAGGLVSHGGIAGLGGGLAG